MQKKVLSPLNKDKKDQASNERSNANKRNISFEQSNEYRDKDEAAADEQQSVENKSNTIFNVANDVKEYPVSKSPTRDQQLKTLNSKILQKTKSAKNFTTMTQQKIA